MCGGKQRFDLLGPFVASVEQAEAVGMKAGGASMVGPVRPYVSPLAQPLAMIAGQCLEPGGFHLCGALLAYHLLTPLSYHA